MWIFGNSHFNGCESFASIRQTSLVYLDLLLFIILALGKWNKVSEIEWEQVCITNCDWSQVGVNICIKCGVGDCWIWRNENKSNRCECSTPLNVDHISMWHTVYTLSTHYSIGFIWLWGISYHSHHSHIYHLSYLDAKNPSIIGSYLQQSMIRISRSITSLSTNKYQQIHVSWCAMANHLQHNSYLLFIHIESVHKKQKWWDCSVR